jgi:hypothetical protein
MVWECASRETPLKKIISTVSVFLLSNLFRAQIPVPYISIGTAITV